MPWGAIIGPGIHRSRRLKAPGCKSRLRGTWMVRFHPVNPFCPGQPGWGSARTARWLQCLLQTDPVSLEIHRVRIPDLPVDRGRRNQICGHGFPPTDSSVFGQNSLNFGSILFQFPGCIPPYNRESTPWSSFIMDQFISHLRHRTPGRFWISLSDLRRNLSLCFSNHLQAPDNSKGNFIIRSKILVVHPSDGAFELCRIPRTGWHTEGRSDFTESERYPSDELCYCSHRLQDVFQIIQPVCGFAQASVGAASFECCPDVFCLAMLRLCCGLAMRISIHRAS